MPALLIVTYDVADPDTYAKYNPGSLPVIAASLAKHGGEAVVSERESHYLAGEARHMTVVLKFPSVEAALAWENDPDYAPAKAFRVAATTNFTSLVAKVFERPEG